MSPLSPDRPHPPGSVGSTGTGAPRGSNVQDGPSRLRPSHLTQLLRCEPRPRQRDVRCEPTDSTTRGRVDLSLFEQTTREVAVNEAGGVLLERLDDGSSAWTGLPIRPPASACPQGGAEGHRPVLRFGIEIVSGRLPEFSLAYPDAALSLDSSRRIVELAAESVDVAFAWARFGNPTLPASGQAQSAPDLRLSGLSATAGDAFRHR